MRIYLVGGAVRDQLLGLKVKERDWVVVGATLEEMLAKGFRQVGRDFPVFLHPKTHEEYALARTERKIGKGYRGFSCVFDPTVTLEDDLKRRDLTINAIAKTRNGKLIDPYGGITDLKQKVLRHVSVAFAEDPVRILRVARFAARFGDFKLHRSTKLLIQNMLEAGEVDALVPERVWQEFMRALSADFPQRFFEVLKSCKVLPKLFPEVARSLNSIKSLLQKAVMLQAKNTIRFAVLFSQTKPEAINFFCDRYRVPAIYKELALMLRKYQKSYEKVQNLTIRKLLDFLEKTDALRRPERFVDFLKACEICSRSRNAITNTNYLISALHKVNEVKIDKILAKKCSGEKIKEEIRKLRLTALSSVQQRD